ncbi:hypothetical protein ScPMuIL_000692 [Solemya velum]
MGGGGERAVERHIKRNKKLMAIDRVKLLVDDMDDFIEIGSIAGMGMDYGNVPRASILTGIGKIHGRYCMILANEGSVKGGTIFPISVKKQLRGQEIAQQNKLPCVYVVDSGGAFLPLQSEIFPDKEQGGRVFFNEAIMSSENIPQVAIVCGSCTAGGAYVPMMADEAVIVHRIGTIFLGGPPLVQAATGEIVTAEELGGATMHCSISGGTDSFAVDEKEAFVIGREIIASLNLSDHPKPSQIFQEPLYDQLDLRGLIPGNDGSNVDMYKMIARIADGSRFREFKNKYGMALLTGFCHVNGHLTGFIANQGKLTEQAAIKGAHFVQLCSQRQIPIVFLQDTLHSWENIEDGEAGGNLLKAHAKMMGAVSCASVPKITVITGNSVGPSSYVMGGRCCSSNFVFCWPNAVIGLMKPDLLTDIVTQEKIDITKGSENEDFRQKILEKYNNEMTAFYAASRLWTDGIVRPEDTRKVIGQCLDIVTAYPQPANTQYSVLRM